MFSEKTNLAWTHSCVILSESLTSLKVRNAEDYKYISIPKILKRATPLFPPAQFKNMWQSKRIGKNPSSQTLAG